MKTIQEKKDIPYAVKGNNFTNYKEVDLSRRTVDLIANTYWYFDTDSDVLVPGVAAKSIQDRGPDSKLGGKIKHAESHDLRNIYAKPTMIEETTLDGKDVLHANSFFPEQENSEKKLIEYNNDMIDQHSIGFRYINLKRIDKEMKDEWEDVLSKLINPEDAELVGMLWLIKEIELFEYSDVPFGANRLTSVLGIKTENKNIHYNNLITKLDVLHNDIRSGSGDKYIMMLEERQIKQMIYELYNPEPPVKITPTEPIKTDTFDVREIFCNINF